MTPQEQIKLAEWAQAGADKCAESGNGVFGLHFEANPPAGGRP